MILGEDELASGILTVKNFATGEQFKVPRGRLAQELTELLALTTLELTHFRFSWEQARSAQSGLLG